MMKNSYLTRTEQEVLYVIRGADIIDFREIGELFPEFSRDMLRKVLSGLVRKGYLLRLKRGLYVVNENPGESVIKNPYRIALALFSGYIAFSSALKLHGLIEYEPFTIFVATSRKSGERVVGEYTIKGVAMGVRATGVTYMNGIYTSTLAKTFFDCFYRPRHCGGYSTLSRALYEVEGLDWGELLAYFRRFASASLCQRSGYILSLVEGELGVPVPKEVLEYLKSRVRGWTRLDPSLPSRGSGSGEWHIIDNVGKERILGWARG